MFRSTGFPRRNFLLAGLAWPLVRSLEAQSPPLVDAAFHLHPHYRAQAPLDSVILKIDASQDDFPSEVFHDRIAPVLRDWSAGLLESPRNIGAIENALAPGFMAGSLKPVESDVVRPGPALEVRHISYSGVPTLRQKEFVEEFLGALRDFSKLETVQFQVTGIDGQRMRVRYELAGEGPGFHREQRIGTWEFEWESAEQYRLLRWLAKDETRSRSLKPWYADITGHAFGSSEQMSHGVDYWRTVLDGASGIDIYGHNGVSVGDIDGDGFDDVYVCQPAGLPNRLYRNRGDGTFEDITDSSGVGLLDNTACAIFADIDNDGRQDLIVVRATGPLLFLNQGGGKFMEKKGAFRFAKPPQGTFTGAAVADYDRDGWLDIYFCLYTYYQGTDQYKYPLPYYSAENGPPNLLMRNNRDGTFGDVTEKSGLNQNNTRYSFCCAWGDYNRDGWPDLYVVNDFGRKNLYRNNGNGTFTDVAPAAGVEDPGAGMSVCWLDCNNDGAEDLYVGNMWTAAGERISAQAQFQQGAPDAVRALYRQHAMGNSLFRNKGDGGFQDATTFDDGGMGRWAWSSDAWDFDHDGFPDLYIANGMVSGPVREDLNSFFWRQVVAKSPNDTTQSPSYEQGWGAINELIRADYTWSGFERNVFYANNGDGTFSDVSGAVGMDFLEDSRSFALADFDQDGRQEVLLKNRNAPQLRLLKNVVEELPASIAFRLRGVKCNRDAIGAAITIETKAGRQTRRLQAGSGFLSQHSKDVFFGLGAVTGKVEASIEWPSGLVQKLGDLPINHRIWVEEGTTPSRMEPFKKSPRSSALAKPQPNEALPETVETWLLVPVPAPDFTLPDASGQQRTLDALRGKPVLLSFLAPGSADLAGLRRLAQNQQVLIVTFGDSKLAGDLPVLSGSDDVAAIYSILYRYLFDRRRDLRLPTSFLLNADGEIVKVYQGRINAERIEKDFHMVPATNEQRLALALPFRGDTENYGFGRNHLALGSVFFQRAYYDQAARFFRLALRDDPASAEARYGLGSVYLKIDKDDEAEDNFRKAAGLKPVYPQTTANAWNNLGLIATRQGLMEQAVGCFREALQLDPKYWTALENLGNAYRELRMGKEALATLTAAVAARPGDPEANYSLAMVYALADKTDEAYKYFQNALRLRPDYPEALNNLGVLCLKTERRDEAVALFEKCKRIAPKFDRSYLNLARIYIVEKEPEKAKTILHELLEQQPDNAEARQALKEMK